MTNVFQGERVRLRALRPDDWPAFEAFDADSELTRSLYFIPFPRSPERSRQWAAEQAMAEPKHDNFFWVIENQQGIVVGSINTHDCWPRNGTFEYGVCIGLEHRRQGYAGEAIRLILRYFFGELRYQKVTVRVYAFNEPSLRLHLKLGFQPEGRLRRMIFSRGEYHDVLLLGMTADEFRAAPV
ncbi:MAG: GNAT family N-acetyltransferase [Chloroflexi bacterium]|nr:GNAT family N-acetyltransferase [Chloroflexota bacterium]